MRYSWFTDTGKTRVLMLDINGHDYSKAQDQTLATETAATD